MIFLDASFVIAYANADDQHHKRAVELVKEIEAGVHGERVVSEYILDEVTTVLLSKTKDYEMAVSAGRELRSMFFVKEDEALLEDTWKRFSTQHKPYTSFTDCNTVAICEREGIAKLATFDEVLGKKSGLLIVK